MWQLDNNFINLGLKKEKEVSLNTNDSSSFKWILKKNFI
jgi:hypothetical protein